MTTTRTQTPPLADEFTNTLIGEYASGEDYVITDTDGDTILLFSDTGKPIPSTDRTQTPSI